jgi:hypothetical protein
MPGSRLEIVEGAGHFPHHADPERFVALLREFVASTEPARYDPDRWRDLLRRGVAAATTAADGAEAGTGAEPPTADRAEPVVAHAS